MSHGGHKAGKSAREVQHVFGGFYWLGRSSLRLWYLSEALEGVRCEHIWGKIFRQGQGPVQRSWGECSHSKASVYGAECWGQRGRTWSQKGDGGGLWVPRVTLRIRNWRYNRSVLIKFFKKLDLKLTVFFFFLRFFWCGLFLKSLLNLLQYAFCFMFWFFGRKACGILAPRSGIGPAPTALEGEVLTTGPPGKSLKLTILNWTTE